MVQSPSVTSLCRRPPPTLLCLVPRFGVSFGSTADLFCRVRRKSAAKTDPGGGGGGRRHSRSGDDVTSRAVSSARASGVSRWMSCLWSCYRSCRWRYPHVSSSVSPPKSFAHQLPPFIRALTLAGAACRLPPAEVLRHREQCRPQGACLNHRRLHSCRRVAVAPRENRRRRAAGRRRHCSLLRVAALPCAVHHARGWFDEADRLVCCCCCCCRDDRR